MMNGLFLCVHVCVLVTPMTDTPETGAINGLRVLVPVSALAFCTIYVWNENLSGAENKHG